MPKNETELSIPLDESQYEWVELPSKGECYPHKKGLKKETYKNIKNWNIVHEIANRYHCSFLLYDREFSFTVIADSLSNLDFEDLDMEGIEELNQR